LIESVRRLVMGLVGALPLTLACAPPPVDQGLTVEQLLENNRTGGYPRCGDVAVVRGTTQGVSLAADTSRRFYALVSGQGAQLEVATQAYDSPAIGPAILVKGPVECGALSNPDGSREKRVSLFELDRRADIPPGTVSLR
jgi:hypothetical protein